MSEDTSKPEAEDGQDSQTPNRSPGAEYVKRTLSNPTAGKEYLRRNLYPALLAELDLDTLTLSSDTFVTQELREIRADVVYDVYTKNGERLKICFLIEHKGDNPEQEQPLYIQVFKYIVYGWELQLMQWKERQRQLLRG